MNDQYILKHGDCGCDVDYGTIREIAKKVHEEYSLSHEFFRAWKMFQFGFAYGKRAERIRRRKVTADGKD